MKLNSTPLIPKWISLIAGFIAALGLFVGASLYISPATFMPELDFSSESVTYLTWMWAARQIAIAAIIGYAVMKQSIPMLKITLAAYAIMNVQDMIIGLIRHDNGLAVGASIFFIVPSIMVYILSKKHLTNTLSEESGEKGSQII